jgi:flagellar basal-body rod protein FlgB
MLKIFSHSDVLGKALDASWLKNDVIANNIANVDTPDFKSSRVEFETELKKAFDSKCISMKKTRDKHFSRPDFSIEPKIIKNTDTTVRMDGNNVDIEKEQIEMVKNAIYYNALIEKISREYGRLKVAINGGK